MEAKSKPGQGVLAMIEQHIDFENELKIKHVDVINRNTLLNSKITTDMVKSGIESISDWVKRISKDIVVWRDDLMHLELELKKIDDEFCMIKSLRESTANYLDTALSEEKLLNELGKIRLQKAQNEQSMINYSRALSKIRGLADKPADESKWSPNKTDDFSVTFDISTMPTSDNIIIPINTINILDIVAKVRWIYSNQSNLDFSLWTVRGYCSACESDFSDDSHICPIDGARKIVPREAWDFVMARFSAAVSAIKMHQSAPINLSDSGEVGPDSDSAISAN